MGDRKLPNRGVGCTRVFGRLLFFGCFGVLSSHAATLRLSQRNEPADLDPAHATIPDEFSIIRSLSEGLVQPNPDGGEPLPAAAERWEISADKKEYTFHLRRGARWSNGERVTAADFLASFRRELSPATAATKAGLFYGVKNARAFIRGEIPDFSQVGFATPDPATVVITLENPTPDFLQYVASGAWIPINPRVVEKLGRAWTKPGSFIGNGPFTLAEWRPHQRIVVRKNPGYYNAANILVDEIQFIAFDDGDAEERAFRAGAIDITMAVPNAKIATYRRDHPGELHHAPLAETRYLAFNANRPPLTKLNVRRALSLAVDRQKIVERVLQGGQRPAEKFLPPVLFSAENTSTESAKEFDPLKAQQLIAEEGFPGGRGFPRLELIAWARSQKDTLEAIQEMWRQNLGIEVSISIQEAKVEQTALRTGAYDIAFWPAIPDVADPLDLLLSLVSDSPENYTHWSNAAFDGVIRALTQTSDPEKREKLLSGANRLIAENCPLAPLYYNEQVWLMRSNVRGWVADPLWARYYAGVTLEAP